MSEQDHHIPMALSIFLNKKIWSHGVVLRLENVWDKTVCILSAISNRSKQADVMMTIMGINIHYIPLKIENNTRQRSSK